MYFPNRRNTRARPGYRRVNTINTQEVRDVTNQAGNGSRRGVPQVV